VFAGLFVLMASVLTLLFDNLIFGPDTLLSDVFKNPEILSNFSLSSFLQSLALNIIISFTIFYLVTWVLIKIHIKIYGFLFIDQIQAILTSIAFSLLFINSFFHFEGVFVEILLLLSSIIYFTHAHAYFKSNVTSRIDHMGNSTHAEIDLHYPLLRLITRLKFTFTASDTNPLKFTVLYRNIFTFGKDNFGANLFDSMTYDDYVQLRSGTSKHNKFSVMLLHQKEKPDDDHRGTVLAEFDKIEIINEFIAILEDHNLEFHPLV